MKTKICNRKFTNKNRFLNLTVNKYHIIQKKVSIQSSN